MKRRIILISSAALVLSSIIIPFCASGCETGTDQASVESDYDIGHDDGYAEGYDKGRKDGYEDGYDEGSRDGAEEYEECLLQGRVVVICPFCGQDSSPHAPTQFMVVCASCRRRFSLNTSPEIFVP